MKTLEIKSGDLVVDNGGTLLLTGEPKLVQDLSIAMLEPYGCDRFHPDWGTILINFIGAPRNVSPMTGAIGSTEIQMLVRAEVVRLINLYMTKQNQMISSDITNGGRTRFSTGELLSGVVAVDVNLDLDKLQVKVILQTVDRSQVTVQSTVRA